MLTRFTPAWAAPHRRAMCALSLVGALLAATPAQALELAGAQFPDQITVATKPLQLNGAGVRYKAIFKVYAAALYVGTKVATPEEFYAAPGPKRIAITMLREVESKELGKAFTTGIEDNTPKAQMGKLITGLVQMGEIFASQKKLLPGETFTNDWIPGTGLVITVKGVPQGKPFKEPEFFNALMRIWLGPQPADLRLKDALLGK